MICVTHILGLPREEQAHILLTTTTETRMGTTVAALRQRYHEVQAGGWLLARDHNPLMAADGSRSFGFDLLADEGGFVFLETHSRYQDYPPTARYGWQFDGIELVEQCNAVVCDADLGQEINAIIEETCLEVAATLPRLPAMTPVDLAAARDLIGDDPALLAYVAAQAEDPFDTLRVAVRGYNAFDPPELPTGVVFRTQQLVRQRCLALKARRRQRGAAALALLRSGNYCEVLVPERLHVRRAIAQIIEGGVV